MKTKLTEYLKATRGAQKALADEFGVDRITLYRWSRFGVPAEQVLRIEGVTGVSRHDLRPDLYPRDGQTSAAQQATGEAA